MSMKRLAVIAAVSSYTSTNNTTTTTTTYFSGNSIAGTGGGGGGIGGLYQGQQSMRPGAILHGNVNVLLGGAMLSVVITVICVVCYCCHRNIKKRTASIYRQRWLENEANMEIYSVEQCYETSGLFAETPDAIANGSIIHIGSMGTVTPNNASVLSTSHGGPPPSYEAVVAMDEIVGRTSPPPSYHVENSPGSGSSDDCVGGADGTKYQCNHENVYSTSNCFAGRYDQKENQQPTNRNHQHQELLQNSFSCCSFRREIEENPVVTTASKARSHVDILNSNNNNNNNGNSSNIQSNNCYCGGCSLCGKLRPSTSSSIDSGFENINTDILNGNNTNGAVGGNGNCMTYNCPLRLIELCNEATMQQNQPQNQVLMMNTFSNGNDIANYNNNNNINNRDSNNNNNNNIRQNNNNNNNNNCNQRNNYLAQSNQSQNQCPNVPSTSTSFSFMNDCDRDTGGGGGLGGGVGAGREGHVVVVGNNNNNNNLDNSSSEISPRLLNRGSSFGNVDDLETFNENGIIRMDMSRIIDKTGLPTYEAALKLESSGYV